MKKRPNDAPPRLRSDARQNRDAVLAAAVALLTTDANVSLEAIARAAGVGIGTLYRHYPTREALVEAAYRREVEKLCRAASELHANHPADVALARFLDHFIDHMQRKRGMVQAMRAVIGAGGKEASASLAMIASAIAPIVEAGRAAGVLRDDVTVDDFIAVKGAIATARPESARRLAAILVDGLRAPSRREALSARRRSARRERALRAAPGTR